MSSDIRALALFQPSTPPIQQLPSPAESPQVTSDCQESSGIRDTSHTLDVDNGHVIVGDARVASSSFIDLTIPLERIPRAESPLFVDGHETNEEQQTSNTQIEDIDTEDELQSLKDLLDQPTANVPSIETPEASDSGEQYSEGEDVDSDYENGSNYSSDGDHAHGSAQVNDVLNAKKQGKRPRRKPAADAREYVARLHEEEDRKYARKIRRESKKYHSSKSSRKRKSTEVDAESVKALKTANGSSLLMTGNSSSTTDGPPLLPIEPIKAKTHAEQFAQIRASIPQNGDIRRKKTQRKDLEEAVKLFGYRKVEACDGGWKLKGMETPLKSHQITAVAWMVKRELAQAEPFGGILADAMGMGKTIMSLACMTGNQADAEHMQKFCNATLVVVPSKIIAQQWQTEARVRTSKTSLAFEASRADRHHRNIAWHR